MTVQTFSDTAMNAPLYIPALADGRDLDAVYSIAAQTLGRIGGDAARAALQPALDEVESNALIRAHHALQFM